MAVKKIPIKKLKPGMYITKLDISWIDSPFMYHHLKIKNKGQIDKLIKAGVKNISIDTSKGNDVAREAAKESKVEGNVSKTLIKEIPQETESSSLEKREVIKKVSFKQEIKAAKVLQGKVTKLAGEINEALKNDEAVDSKLVSPLIAGTIESLERNNQALASLINMQRKDQTLANHAFGTFSLVLSLALKLELTETEREALGMAAFFHDSGWLKLPLNLIGKKSPYTASEKKLIQQHVVIGLKTLQKNCDLDGLITRLISEHHEYLNGTGFPKGLVAEKIHPLTKIFQVAVRYDELVHGMLDTPALTPHGALAQLYKETKQGLLDESSVSTMVSLLSVYPVGSAVLLSNKEKGIVVETNTDSPKEPKVKVFYDMSGMAHAKPTELDLSKQKNGSQLTIVSVLDMHNPDTDPANLLEL